MAAERPMLVTATPLEKSYRRPALQHSPNEAPDG